MPQIKSVADGVRLCTVKTERFKTSSIKITMALPMQGKLGANALLLYLLKRSCKKYPDFQMLNGRLDELYGASVSAGVSKSGEAQLLSLGITCIDDRFALENGESVSAECAQLLADMLFEPNCSAQSFPEEAVADEKRLLKQRIEEEINDKRTFARLRCEEIMCSEEAYGKNKYGTLEELDAVSAEDAYAAWQSLIKNAVFMITAVNSSGGDKIAKIFKKGFSAVEREPLYAETEFRVKASRFRRVNEEFKVNQGKLVMGFRAGMADREDCYPAEVIMTDLFGGNVYSKLFMNVREKLSLCYYCWSRFISRKGIVLVDCGIDTDKEKKASAEILAQLADMRSGKFTDDDINASKMGMRERWMSSVDNPSGICSWYGVQVLDDEIKTPEEMVEQLEGVTREQICAAAKRMTLDAVYMLSAAEENVDED